AYDAGSLRKLETGETRSADGACAIQLLTAPGAPRNVQANVSGRDLTLTCTNIGAASHFCLDTAFAPGHTNSSRPLGPAASAPVAGVPPGAYALRLRGGNLHGGGRPSTEIAVTIN